MTICFFLQFEIDLDVSGDTFEVCFQSLTICLVYCANNQGVLQSSQQLLTMFRAQEQDFLQVIHTHIEAHS